jgi:hypothetical protein
MRNSPGSAAEYRFRVEVSTQAETTVIYEHGAGAAIGLVEAHWSPDQGEVGVLVCNMFTKPLFLGYDITHRRPVDGSLFRPIIEDQLRKKYSLTSGADATGWACSPSGNAAYATRGGG